MWITAAVQLAQAGVSIYQAMDAKDRIEDAATAAKRATKQALRLTEVNPYAELSVPGEAYRESRKNIHRGLAQGIEAGQTADPRGSAATAGQAMATALGQEQKIQEDQAGALYQREVLIAGQDVNNINARRDIRVAEAEGAQQAAADAQQAQADAITGAAQGLAAVGSTIDAGQALYKKDKLSRNLDKGLRGKDSAQLKGQMKGAIQEGLKNASPDEQMRMALSLGKTHKVDGADIINDDFLAAISGGGDFDALYDSFDNTQFMTLGQNFLTGRQARQMRKGKYQYPTQQSAGVGGGVSPGVVSQYPPYNPALDFEGYNFPK